MKRLKSIENDQVQLEVVECDCGYHFGIDATYLDQVVDFRLECPACGMRVMTSEVCPEDPEDSEDPEDPEDSEPACNSIQQHYNDMGEVHMDEHSRLF